MGQPLYPIRITNSVFSGLGIMVTPIAAVIINNSITFVLLSSSSSSSLSWASSEGLTKHSGCLIVSELPFQQKAYKSSSGKDASREQDKDLEEVKK